ncbi:helix-turn-helix domain-containing protein [bacterium]|nr:helix-turn-helix domain-containing protein [bacterium]
MTNFVRHDIQTVKSLGERLSQTRERLNLSLEEVARSLNIQTKYLKALENGYYSWLPGEIYVKNFLRKYSKLLNLPSQELIDLYQKEMNLLDKIDNNRKKKNKGLIRPYYWKKKIIIGIIILGILSFIGFRIKNLIFLPYLVVYNPSRDLAIQDKFFIEIRGKVDREASLFVNNQIIFPDTEGGFKKKIDLSPGLNIIKITAKGEHGREKTVLRKVMVLENSEVKNQNTKRDESLER